MKSFSETILNAMQALSLSADETLLAQRRLDAAGMGADSLKKFHKEWSLDCIFTDGPIAVRPRYPSLPAFPVWLNERLDNPYSVPLVKTGAAKTKFGASLAMDGLLLHWPQTISWAKHFRLHGNDTDACLSHAWLKASFSDPGKYFMRMMEALVSTEAGSVNIPYSSSPENHTNIPEGFRPLCLICADREFSVHIQRQGSSRTASMAESVRIAAAQEAVREGGRILRKKIEECNPHYRITVLSAACESGMVSDEILSAYHALLRESETGNLPEVQSYVLLSGFLGRYVGTAVELSSEDREIRKKVISNIDITWLSEIPKDWHLMMDGRGGSPLTVRKWTGEIETEARRPPLHPLLDYGLWLAERR